ncbi:MAG: hypothetical protein VYD64_06415 [Pseudomonadota bacterium]|nr:hypothetical protein [Pseudomonadota bacterium]
MQKRKLALALPIAMAAILAGQGIAHAQLAPIMLLDMMVKRSNKEALATPGHAEWCAASRPGYRAQWNNWRNDDGRVTYCASPYYTPPWKMPYKG